MVAGGRWKCGKKSLRTCIPHVRENTPVYFSLIINQVKLQSPTFSHKLVTCMTVTEPLRVRVVRRTTTRSVMMTGLFFGRFYENSGPTKSQVKTLKDRQRSHEFGHFSQEIAETLRS